MSAVLFDRALTEQEMAEISDAIDSAYSDPEINAGLCAATAFYRLAARSLGFDSIEAMAKAQPGEVFLAVDFSIDETQWHEIGQLLLTAEDKHHQRAVSSIERINVLLDWMNSGPSARKAVSAGG